MTIYDAIKNEKMGIDSICENIASNTRLHFILDEFVTMNCCYDDGFHCEHESKNGCDIYGHMGFSEKCPKYNDNLRAIKNLLLDWFNQELAE